MKSKRGFTLIEIIICIGLIALIGTVSVVTFNKVTSDDKEKDKYVKGVKDATNVFIESKKFENRRVKITDAGYIIQLKELVEEGLIKEETYNPFKDKTTAEVDYDCVKIYLDNNKNIGVEYPVDECINKSPSDIAFHLEKRVNLEVTNNVFVNLKSSKEVFETYENGSIDFEAIQSGNVGSIYYVHNDNASIYTLSPGSSLITEEEIEKEVNPLLTNKNYIFVKEDKSSGKLLKTSNFNDIENRKWKVKATYDFDDSKGYTIVDKNIVDDIALNDNSAPFLMYKDYSKVSEHIDVLSPYYIEYFDNFEGWLSWDYAESLGFINVDEENKKIIIKDSSGNNVNYTYDSKVNDSLYEGYFYPSHADASCYPDLNGFEFIYNGNSIPLSEAFYNGMVEYKDGKFKSLSSSLDMNYIPPKLERVVLKSGEKLGITTFSMSMVQEMINGANLYYIHNLDDREIFINNYKKFIVHKNLSGTETAPITDYSFDMYLTDNADSEMYNSKSDYLIGKYISKKNINNVVCDSDLTKEQIDDGVLCYNPENRYYNYHGYIAITLPYAYGCTTDYTNTYKIGNDGVVDYNTIEYHLDAINYINSLEGPANDKKTIIDSYIQSHELYHENIVEVDGKYWIDATDR